ncbi:uncharacterized protein LOC117534297 isoform X4 [Gymnodraco acuticeps]|uniref:Uncharacterized protein LOC117534297 isoform X4 n=1 Tax=Gymnodraco acuticeps TaxID=8218 RepID=A0A6P8SV87_GYMAC|nr:uncharacterized protein LOC117534297 isoform X4 [Gymnodraco acuticeps]
MYCMENGMMNTVCGDPFQRSNNLWKKWSHSTVLQTSKVISDCPGDMWKYDVMTTIGPFYWNRQHSVLTGWRGMPGEECQLGI